MKKLIKLNDINKIITLLAFPILIVSCNSDKEIVDGLSNRILKIDSLIDSQNKIYNVNNYVTGNTGIIFQAVHDFNVLNDSINTIKIDISTNQIKDENKVILTDNQPVKLVLNNGDKNVDFKSSDTNEAVRKMIKMARSSEYNQQEQNVPGV